MEISLKPSLIIKIRLEVLYEVVKEFTQAFCVSYSYPEVLKRGIVERQYFKEISIYFLNVNHNAVGKATISIDWEKHTLMASTEEKNIFNIDPTKSINEQLSEALPKIIEHINHMKENKGVTETQLRYSLIDEIRYDNEKYKEACIFCGLSLENHPLPKWENKDSPKITVKFSPQDLSELGITVIHDK